MNITNKFKRNISQDKVQYGIWNGIPHSYAAEICAGAGFDFVVIDAEHGPFEISDIISQMQAMGRYPNCSSVVRIANDDPVLMKRLMDAGVQSFIIPMIESADQAKAMFKAMRYPPVGIRGVGTALARAAQWNRVNDYFGLADEEMCLICQIESVKGVEALESILQVEGVDVIFLGPADLAASMGMLGDPGHPDVVNTVKSCISKIVNSGKKAGILSSDKELLAAYEEQGVRMLAVGLDTILLAKATKGLAEHFKPELKGQQSNTKY